MFYYLIDYFNGHHNAISNNNGLVLEIIKAILDACS